MGQLSEMVHRIQKQPGYRIFLRLIPEVELLFELKIRVSEKSRTGIKESLKRSWKINNI